MARNQDLVPAQRNRDQGLAPSRAAYDASPFQMMRRVQNDMDRLFNQALAGSLLPTIAGLTALEQWTPTMDISENDQEVRIDVDLPGVKPDDINIQVQNNTLVLRAELRQEDQSDQNRRFYRRQRQYGYFEEVVSLPQNIDEDNISAEFQNGVLMVHIPKSQQAESQARRISVSADQGSQQIGQQSQQGQSQQGQNQKQQNQGQQGQQSNGQGQ